MSRAYWIGLPVGVTVHDDGAVTYEVDTSEATDIDEGAPVDDELVPLYSEAEVEADRAAVADSLDRTVAIRDAASNVLAVALLDHDDLDHLEALEALRPVLSPPVFDATCERMEVCPVHLCDEQICRDDQADCAIGDAAGEDDGAPCCLDPECPGRRSGRGCTFPGYAANH